MSEESVVEFVPLHESVRSLVKRYLESAGKGKVTDLHQMLMEQIEPPLLNAVMEKCKYNQSRAALLLGISRGTLRSMLIKYFDERYCGRREKREGE